MLISRPYPDNKSDRFFPGWSFATPWTFQRTRVRLLSSKATKARRSTFTHDIRQSFIAEALNSLGGTNQTLAFIQFAPHTEIHHFINDQTANMREGQEKEIWIPVFPGPIWGPFPPYILPKKLRPVRPSLLPDSAFLAIRNEPLCVGF